MVGSWDSTSVDFHIEVDIGRLEVAEMILLGHDGFFARIKHRHRHMSSCCVREEGKTDEDSWTCDGGSAILPVHRPASPGQLRRPELSFTRQYVGLVEQSPQETPKHSIPEPSHHPHHLFRFEHRTEEAYCRGTPSLAAQHKPTYSQDEPRPPWLGPCMY